MHLHLREALHSARDTYRHYSRFQPDSNGDGHGEIVEAPDAQVIEPAGPGEDPDVLLDVPNLKVDRIGLEVDQLRARVALDANVLQLLELHVGADVELGRVKLDIEGVEAQALLKVRLDTLKAILDRVFASVDNNPQLLERLVEQLGAGLTEVGAAADHAAGALAPAVADTERSARSAVARSVSEHAARSALERAARGETTQEDAS
jgi:hypothetical protein